MTGTATLLRDVIEIPERVHRGDFVLKLAEGIGDEKAVADTIRQYVVTPELAERFDDALELIKSAVESGSSRAAYLDGSFGSGKSHFMAILHELLRGNPDVRRKDQLVPVVTKHDPWLTGRRFLLVPYHLIGSSSLSEAVLGGYVRRVAELHPDAPPPPVYRDDPLIENARELRATEGDERFIASLPTRADEEWGESGWDSASLDNALNARPGDPQRQRLVSDLLQSRFTAYRQVVSGLDQAYLPLDEGLSIISRHARDTLGYDVLVLLLDELVLWLNSRIGDRTFVAEQAELVSKFVESAERDRPAPIVSFIPRQRDLRDLVGRDVAGAQGVSLFDILSYWDGRFDRLSLSDTNLPAIIAERLLTPRSPEARVQLDTAFEAITRTHPQVWEALLNPQSEGASDQESFRKTYPFSPAFVHTMVDISGALQRERTALRLMLQLLVDYRDTLELGRLIPLGAIYDVLASGEDRPFTDKLRREFDQVRDFYRRRLRPWLLTRHGLKEEDVVERMSGPFRGDDLIVKTVLLKALVPNVPALKTLSVNQLAALNHGWIPAMPPSRPGEVTAKLLRDLMAEFGEIRVHGDGNPIVDIALIGVDTKAILDRVQHHLDDAGMRRTLKAILWQELGVGDDEPFVARREFVWRGSRRTIELSFANVRELTESTFEPAESGALRVVIDYPFDEPKRYPADDVNRLREVRANGNARSDVLAWLPSFLSQERLDDLGTLVLITHVLEGSRLTELTAELSEEDRYHAKMEFESRRSALDRRVREALKKAYGVAGADEADLGARAERHVMVMNEAIDLKPPAGVGLGAALETICGRLLDEVYPDHPNFDPGRRQRAYSPRELQTVHTAVEQAMQDRSRRVELSRADQPVVRRIADPLGLGTTGEAALVLNDNWPLAIERRAAADGFGPADDLPVGRLREWIAAEQPGLPADLVDFVVLAYALIKDRSWVRGGNVVAAPDLKALRNDMLLRAQELPTDEEFEAASVRAVKIFQLERQPVRSARTTRLLAEQVRRKAGERLTDAETLVTELVRHAEILGLDPTAEGTSEGRLGTARQVCALLDSLAGVTDDTALLRRLAGFDLARPAEVYGVSLREAGAALRALAAVEWQLLDRLPDRAENGPDAEPARVILDKLRSAARHDEQAVHLAPALAAAKQAALELFVKTRPGPPGGPGAGTGDASGTGTPSGGGQVDGTLTVRAADLEAGLAELRQAVEAESGTDPDAEFEVSWRRIGR